MGSRIPAQRQQRDPRSPVQKRDDDWRVQIDDTDYDELLESAAGARSGIQNWAYNKAAYRLGFNPIGPPPAELDDDYIRLAYLFMLKKATADGDEDGLELLLEPLDDEIVAAPPVHQWIEYRYVPAGETTASFVERMKQAARSMTWKTVGPWTAEIEDLKPGVWADCWSQAKRNLRHRRLPVTMESLGETAVEIAIDHYADKGKWPMAFVPPSMRQTVPVQSAPPAWAA